MNGISEEMLKLELNEDIFKEIKFFVSGEVHEKIVDLLKCGGAERLNYFSDYVTHLIVGENAEENDIVDASDVYEIPALIPKWVLMCAALRRLVSFKPYLYIPGGKIFSNLIFCFSNIREDLNYLWALITYNGGCVQLILDKNCSYLVTIDTTSAKYEKAESLGPEIIKIVSPDWVVETVKNKSFADVNLFHPKLINWPKPVKHESTTAITGFEPEYTEHVEHGEEITVPNSTQALLEKLKQRMPWNQPSREHVAPQTSNSDLVSPPNVVAPNFIQNSNKQMTPVSRSQVPPAPVSQPQQQNMPPSPVPSSFTQVLPRSPTTSSNQQIPRTIVHHTPNHQQNFQQPQQQSDNPLNISRLIGQPQARANLHLRGQLGQSQLQQQLLQQRMQLQNQQNNVLQRTSTGQIPVQQLLQQQLAQNQLGQRQLLQNQLNPNQILQQQQIVPNQHLGQLTQQQLAQLQHLQLKHNQQMQLAQNQQQSQPNQNQQIQLNQNQQQLQLNQNQSQIQLNQNQQQMQLNQNPQIQLNQNQQQVQLNQNQQQIQLIQSQQQIQLNQPQQQIQLNQNQQEITLNQNQQQMQLNRNQPQIQQDIPLNQNQPQGQLNRNQQQISMTPNQQLQINQNQQQIQGSSSQQQIQRTPNQPVQDQQQLIQNQLLHQQQSQMNSQSNQVTPNQLPNQMNQQQIQMNRSHNLVQQNINQILQQKQQFLNQQSATSQQQIVQNQPNLVVQQQQFVNLPFSQTQGLNHDLNQLGISQQNLNQQKPLNQQQNLNQQQTVNQTINQQQTINQNINQQQTINQNINQQQTINQNINLQQTINQTINQQQTMNQQINMNQQQNINQQKNMNQQQNVSLNAQALNRQLSTQNLGQQLNQQQLNQQLNHQLLQSQINPQIQLNQQDQLNQHNQLNQQLNQQSQLNHQINQQSQLNQQQINQQNLLSQQQINRQTHLGQQLNQQQNQLNQQSLDQGLDQSIQALNQQINQGVGQQLQQALNQQNLQQQQQLSRQNIQQQQLQTQQQSLNQQNLQQQQLNQQINQQVNPGLPQQVIRTQFQQQPNIGQQILINQTSPGTPQPQRAQISQHLWAQQPSPQALSGPQIIRHPVNIVQQAGPRVQWSPNSQQGNQVPQRHLIQLDARTHNELQKMPPEQQALFVAKLQRQRQLLKQVQQRGGGGSHILIRGNVPPGLTTQQQVQWLQQQAKQQGIVLPPNIQQQNITPGTLTQGGINPNIQHAPGLSPINQNAAPFTEQNQQQQLQLRQYRLQQLQLQREQAQKNHLAQQQGTIQQPTVVRPISQPQLADSTTNPPQDGNIPHPLVVNAKTKTALANMLNIKLQSGASSIGGQRPEPIQEPSAAGTLRLMTAQHNAALNSKPQEIIALQRRTISGPNGEIIKPPGTPALPITPINDPPKLQYCPKPALPLQHRPGPFYGHNPNLKLPSDLFLLGCIFVVVELESFLEDRIPGWQKTIEKHGGEVEKQYCSRVTHVLCETQRHGVVMQALRDCKRCVTLLWLMDVMQRKQVLPPWTALHLPNIYLDTAPASKHLISITGFEGYDRNRVKQMIKYTGARCTTYFSKHNTLLISTKADGEKCAYAKKWQIPVVNVQWLTDVMLGHFSAMNQMEHQIYQQYSNPPNFSFDPKLVPNLMVAWKAPINISQESYERVKRCASPVVLPKKPKKLKAEPTDENDNISEEQITNSTHRILFSMVTETKEMQKMIRDLGGAVAKDHRDFTHLIMPHLARSNKLFFAIVKGAHIVSDQWLKDSHVAKAFLPENNYCLNSKDFNYQFKCDIDQTLLTRNRNRLFEGKFFFVTPSVFPSKKVLTELIQCCGGIVERVRRSSAQIEATSINSPYSYFIITHENDLHLVADLLKNKKDKMRIVCNAEFIYSAILKQTLDIDPYVVCVL